MKKYLVVMFAVAFLLAGFLFVDSRGPSAQRITKPTPEKQQVMPEVVVLGKNAKLGRVTFNHLKHNGGEYNAGGPIACIECHHTAQPAADLVSAPPHKTVWPAGRTTTLTAELFAEDPNKAGVAACRDCHARAGTKPKLLDKMPVFEDIGTETVTKLTNQLAFHQACDTCHFQIGFRSGDTKAPKSTNCTTCHIAPKGKR
ncbi:MAG TPA: cytochrome c3 family protein [Pyrinomonadaceae bacterium]|nr:cytochrome c3 family protein [Chloracidobacterium sp.]MBP9936106.1 cytochrome c3 family protein [Pyrinomonadaceae bacterium]MBK7803624.1 cytochrome c3 family protein [Chloracidobacterium sp.]MBL0239026.1 cytochrome c3 family protein [Chloracidobacterium sp.]HQX55583.1 cytochrome c3 family protein [Pyrinomonadaceae bacterium]